MDTKKFLIKWLYFRRPGDAGSNDTVLPIAWFNTTKKGVVRQILDGDEVFIQKSKNVAVIRYVDPDPRNKIDLMIIFTDLSCHTILCVLWEESPGVWAQDGVKKITVVD